LNDTNHHAKQEHRFIGFDALTRFKNAKALKTTSEIALVGPLIRWEEEPKIEATAVTTIAE